MVRMRVFLAAHFTPTALQLPSSNCRLHSFMGKVFFAMLCSVPCFICPVILWSAGYSALPVRVLASCLISHFHAAPDFLVIRFGDQAAAQGSTEGRLEISDYFFHISASIFYFAQFNLAASVTPKI